MIRQCFQRQGPWHDQCTYYYGEIGTKIYSKYVETFGKCKCIQGIFVKEELLKNMEIVKHKFQHQSKL